MADGAPTGRTEQTANKQLGMRALLIGATGAVGECLLGELLASKNFAKVVTLGRRAATVPEAYAVDQKAEESSGRLEQHVVDFETLTSESAGEHFKAKDVFFCALGTTRRAAGSAAAFRHIDHDYVVKCAEVAKEASVSHVSYVSSTSANTSSFFLYLKTKGQVEESLKKIQFPKTSIFRPGMLDRGSKMRFMEKVGALFMSKIPCSTVAKAMVVDAENFVRSKLAGNADKKLQSPSAVTYENEDILSLSSSGQG